jgi:acyl-CoA reductase-like NAD-dependent aldehyde dehydrogenase
MKKYQLFINGKWQDPQSGDWFESHDPFTDEAWALIPRANEQDVHRAIDAFLQTKSVWLSTAETVPNPFVIK